MAHRIRKSVRINSHHIFPIYFPQCRPFGQRWCRMHRVLVYSWVWWCVSQKVPHPHFLCGCGSVCETTQSLRVYEPSLLSTSSLAKGPSMWKINPKKVAGVYSERIPSTMSHAWWKRYNRSKREISWKKDCVYDARSRCSEEFSDCTIPHLKRFDVDVLIMWIFFVGGGFLKGDDRFSNRWFFPMYHKKLDIMLLVPRHFSNFLYLESQYTIVLTHQVLTFRYFSSEST